MFPRIPRGWVLAAIVAAPAAFGQVELANLREDVRGLTQRVGELSLRIEQLERENQQLRQSSAGLASSYVTLTQLNTAVNDLNAAIRIAVASSKSEVLQQVGAEMEKLAQRTNTALESVAKGMATRPVVQSTFSDAYPKEGVSYTVQKGDTLAVIAKKTGAKVQDIIDANKIADPSRIVTGQTLFIPGRKIDFMAVAPKSRLGRGLGGLIAAGKPTTPISAPAPGHAMAAPEAPAPAPVGNALGYQEIGVHLIEPSPYQARREIPPDQLHELAESIRAEGLLQPIVVRKTGEKFQLIAGERRWRAFQHLKIKAIPARIVEASNASSAALGLIENLQREGLNPIEEAHGYASLIRDFDLTQESAADRVGKGRASVANSLRLLSLEGETQGYLAKGLLSVGHAKVLLGINDTAQRGLLARRVIEEGLSVRATEKLVQAGKNNGGGTAPSVKPAARGLSSKDASTVAGIEKKLTSHLGARVAVLHTPKKGRIVIEYRGNEDLQRLLEKLGIEA